MIAGTFHMVKEVTSELGPEAGVGVWCTKNKEALPGTARSTCKELGCVWTATSCLTRWGDGQYQEQFLSRGPSTDIDLGGVWEGPSEKSWRVPPAPPLRRPGRVPQAGTGGSSVAPLAVVCARTTRWRPLPSGSSSWAGALGSCSRSGVPVSHGDLSVALGGPPGRDQNRN